MGKSFSAVIPSTAFWYLPCREQRNQHNAASTFNSPSVVALPGKSWLGLFQQWTGFEDALGTSVQNVGAVNI